MSVADDFIYDDARDGRPYDDALGFDPDSPAGAIPLIPSYRTIPHREWYGAALAALLAGVELPDPSFALTHSADPLEFVMRDPTVAHCMNIRTRTVAGSNWNIAPARSTPRDRELSEILYDLLNQITNFSAAKVQLAKAVLLGSAFCVLEYEPKRIVAGGIDATWIVPTKLQPIDRRRFRWVPQDDGHLCREYRDVIENTWKPWPNDWPLVEWRYDDEESRLHYGRGVIDSVYTAVYGKKIAEIQIRRALRAYGEGIVRGSSKGLRATSKNNVQRAQAFYQQILEMKETGIIVHDDTDDIEILMPGGEGVRSALAMLSYYDDQIRGVILGAKLHAGGGSAGDDGGSYARAEVEREVSDRLAAHDQELFDSTISQDLVQRVRKLNWGLLREYADIENPEYQTVKEAATDSHKEAEKLALMLPRIKFREDEVFDKLGYTPPQEGDTTVGGVETEDEVVSNENEMFECLDGTKFRHATLPVGKRLVRKDGWIWVKTTDRWRREAKYDPKIHGDDPKNPKPTPTDADELVVRDDEGSIWTKIGMLISDLLKKVNFRAPFAAPDPLGKRNLRKDGWWRKIAANPADWVRDNNASRNIGNIREALVHATQEEAKTILDNLGVVYGELSDDPKERWRSVAPAVKKIKIQEGKELAEELKQDIQFANMDGDSTYLAIAGLPRVAIERIKKIKDGMLYFAYDFVDLFDTLDIVNDTGLDEKEIGGIHIPNAKGLISVVATKMYKNREVGRPEWSDSVFGLTTLAHETAHAIDFGYSDSVPFKKLLKKIPAENHTEYAQEWMPGGEMFEDHKQNKGKRAAYVTMRSEFFAEIVGHAWTWGPEYVAARYGDEMAEYLKFIRVLPGRKK